MQISAIPSSSYTAENTPIPVGVRLPVGAITQHSVDLDKVRVTELFAVPMGYPDGNGVESFHMLADPQEALDVLSQRFAAHGLQAHDAMAMQPSLLRAASARLAQLEAGDTPGRQKVIDLYSAAQSHALALLEHAPSPDLDHLLAVFADGLQQLNQQKPRQQAIIGISAWA